MRHCKTNFGKCNNKKLKDKKISWNLFKKKIKKLN